MNVSDDDYDDYDDEMVIDFLGGEKLQPLSFATQNPPVANNNQPALSEQPSEDVYGRGQPVKKIVLSTNQGRKYSAFDEYEDEEIKEETIPTMTSTVKPKQ